MLSEKTLIKKATKNIESEFKIDIRSIEDLKAQILQVEKYIEQAEQILIENREAIDLLKSRKEYLDYELSILNKMKNFVKRGGNIQYFLEELGLIANKNIKSIKDINFHLSSTKRDITIIEDNISRLQVINQSTNKTLSNFIKHLEVLRSIPHRIKVERYKYLNKDLNISIY